MDPINSWLDPAQVRQLAERLAGHGVATPSVESVDTGTSSRAHRAGTVESPIAAPTTAVVATEPEASLPAGRLSLGLHRFSEWLNQHHPAAGVFILDHEGRVMFEQGDCESVHFLARYATAPHQPAGARGGNYRAKVGPASTVEVIPVDTAAGRMALGMVVAKPLHPSAVAGVTKELLLAAGGPAQP